MAKVREDLVGSVRAVDQEGRSVLLTAGQKIPKGYFVGGHAVEDGDPEEQTAPWKQKSAVAASSAEGQLEQLVASGASPEEIVQAVADHLGVEVFFRAPQDQGDENGDDSGAQSGADDDSGSGDDSGDGEPAGQALQAPPKSGAGSGAEAWRDYATKAVAAAGLNIDIPADAGRGDIIDALNSAGIATE